jgi:mannose/cellobiose epimerase-like protein (N-acyl-D-glucosamine 2-epimerase family)
MAFALMFRRTGNNDYADRLRAVWAFIRTYCVDPVVGEWHDLLGPDRRGQGAKGSGWKAGYHATQALLDAAVLMRGG